MRPPRKLLARASRATRVVAIHPAAATLEQVQATLILVAVAVALGGTLAALPWLAARSGRRGTGGNPFAPFEEMWHPAVHRARIGIEVQAEHGDPSPAPGDPPWACRPSDQP